MADVKTQTEDLRKSIQEQIASAKEAYQIMTLKKQSNYKQKLKKAVNLYKRLNQ